MKGCVEGHQHSVGWSCCETGGGCPWPPEMGTRGAQAVPSGRWRAAGGEVAAHTLPPSWKVCLRDSCVPGPGPRGGCFRTRVQERATLIGPPF